MIRFVVGPERSVVPDLAERLPGRGMWLSARRDVLEGERVLGKLAGCFARAAGGPVTVPPDLSSVLREGLARRIGEQLGLARRAGQTVAGFEKAREWLRAGRAGLVVQAADGSLDERRRLLGGADVIAVAPLSAAALGSIFGRDHVVHVAIAPGRLAERIRIDAGRLAGVTGEEDRSQSGPTGDSTD